jgi:uncharacterized membrane protein YeaQ/YmgE (transglycosylase-associated protein family)
MSFLWYLLIGLGVGILARILMPGRQNLGIIMTVLLGALGAFLAGQTGEWLDWWTWPSWLGIAVSVVFAIILIAIYTGIKGSSNRNNNRYYNNNNRYYNNSNAYYNNNSSNIKRNRYWRNKNNRRF